VHSVILINICCEKKKCTLSSFATILNQTNKILI
jgi:hypothetical protein